MEWAAIAPLLLALVIAVLMGIGRSGTSWAGWKPRWTWPCLHCVNVPAQTVRLPAPYRPTPTEWLASHNRRLRSKFGKKGNMATLFPVRDDDEQQAFHHALASAIASMHAHPLQTGAHPDEFVQRLSERILSAMSRLSPEAEKELRTLFAVLIISVQEHFPELKVPPGWPPPDP